MVPYRLSFGDTAEGAFAVLEYIMDCYFILDLGNFSHLYIIIQRLNNSIVISFFTGYYKQGNLIMNRRLIMMNYLKTWFIVDFLASFPYTWIIDNVDPSDDQTNSN